MSYIDDITVDTEFESLIHYLHGYANNLVFIKYAEFEQKKFPPDSPYEKMHIVDYLFLNGEITECALSYRLYNFLKHYNDLDTHCISRIVLDFYATFYPERPNAPTIPLVPIIPALQNDGLELWYTPDFLLLSELPPYHFDIWNTLLTQTEIQALASPHGGIKPSLSYDITDKLTSLQQLVKILIDQYPKTTVGQLKHAFRYYRCDKVIEYIDVPQYFKKVKTTRKILLKDIHPYQLYVWSCYMSSDVINRIIKYYCESAPLLLPKGIKITNLTDFVQYNMMYNNNSYDKSKNYYMDLNCILHILREHNCYNIIKIIIETPFIYIKQ
jgi:hypothetical protein